MLRWHEQTSANEIRIAFYNLMNSDLSAVKQRLTAGNRDRYNTHTYTHTAKPFQPSLGSHFPYLHTPTSASVGRFVLFIIMPSWWNVKGSFFSSIENVSLFLCLFIYQHGFYHSVKLSITGWLLCFLYRLIVQRVLPYCSHFFYHVTINPLMCVVHYCGEI